jgi:hypothetical protein
LIFIMTTSYFARGLVLLALFAVPFFAPAAAPESELLRLTPKESTFCVVVRDVRGFTASAWDGPFANAFRQSALGKALAAAPETAQLEAFMQMLPKALQVEWAKVRDEVFGDAIVLAYQNGPPGKPEGERGLLLTWTRDSKLAASVIERLNAVQKDSGELTELRPEMHKGETFYRRVKNKGPNEFYFQKGQIFAFGTHESAIRRAIDLDQELPPAERQTPPLVMELERVGPSGLATIWLNPRSFDAELANKLQAAKGQEAAFLAAFARIWKALDGVGVNCRVAKDVEIDLTFATRKDDLPPALSKFASAFKEPSAFWQAVPDDALFAVAGRFDLPAFIELLTLFMTPEAHQSLQGSAEQGLAPIFGKKLVQLLPSHLGPEFGICITPPRLPNALLPEFLAAVRIQSDSDNHMEQKIKDALDVATTLLRVNLNAKTDDPVKLEMKKQDGVEVRYLSHDKLFPPGIQPAFAVKNGYLLLASHPDRILAAKVSANAKPGPGPNRLAVMSLRHLREYLSNHREALADAISKQQPAQRAEVLGQFDKILMAIELFDRVELVNNSKRPGEMKLTLRLSMMQPVVSPPTK